MIVDSHVYCFVAPDELAGHRDVATHLGEVQVFHALHHQPAWRTRDRAPSDATRLRVVLAPGTTAQELASLLAAIDARIVYGPSPAGAYALALSPDATDEAMAASLARLRADARVLFAEPLRVEPAR